MKIGIIITCCNQVEYTKNCVNSIKTSYPFELIIIDDFSIDGTKTWLKSELGPNAMGALGVHTIIDADTESLGEKWNLGMEKAEQLGCEAGLICNNDILFSPFTIDNLVSRLELAKQLGENVVLVSAANQRGNMKPEDILTYEAPKEVSESEGPDFSCFLQDIKAWHKLEKFPKVFKPCYFEDNYWHTVIKAQGLKAIATTAAPYYHYGSITQNSVAGGLCKPPQFERNRAIFVEIFGAEPDKVDLEYVRKKFNITL